MSTLHEPVYSSNEIGELQRKLSQAVQRLARPGASFAELEDVALRMANEVVRRMLEAELQARSDELEADVLIDGIAYTEHSEGTVRYFSLCGPLEISRSRFRRSTPSRQSKKGQSSLVALDLAEGLIERMTPALAFSLSHAYAQGPMRHYAAAMDACRRIVPSRATLERKAKAVAGAAKQKVVSIEQRVRRTEKVPTNAYAISLGLDRTSVAMIEKRRADCPPNSPRRRRRRPHVRTPPAPFDVNWRMGYVGTVAIVDHHGDTLVAKRYGATAAEGPAELVKRVMADVTRALKQMPQLIVSVVQDGAPELWGLIWDAMHDHGVKKYRQVIDRYHVNERLAHALSFVEKDNDKRAAIYRQWQRLLDTRAKANWKIQDWLQANRHRVSKGCLGHYDAHLTYLGNPLVNYARMKRDRLPIGSGVTEGACKSLYAARTKRSGQRWCLDGLSAVLTMRAILLSDRFEKFWRHFAANYRRNIQPATY